MSESKPCGDAIQEVNSCYPVKRARHSSVWKDDNEDDEVGTQVVFSNTKTEYITDVIANFLVSINAPLDSYKDSHFRTLLSRVAQHGVPPCLLRDDSLPIQKSLWNLEHVVNEHIRKVKDSWKETGCTMMLYKLDQVEGSFSSFHKGDLVFGFYSVKGFFFVEGRTLPPSDSLRSSFKSHVLNLPIDDITQAIYHTLLNQPCELSSLAPGYDWFIDLMKNSSVSCMPCVRQTINQSFGKLDETSDCWVRKVMTRSERLHKYVLDKNLYLDWEKEKARMVVDGVRKCWFSRFESIIRLEYELKTWLLHLSDIKSSLEEIATIIDSHDFWRDGRRLYEALLPLFSVQDTLDNLVPTSGYLQLAINAAIKNGHFAQNEVDGQYFDDLLKGNHCSGIQDVTTYLSPGFYKYYQEEEKILFVSVKEELESIVAEEEKEAMHVELEAYTTRSSNPFANLYDDEPIDYHPVALWDKYGDKFPVLKKCAMKLLSQPASCLCKQVKKHLSQIEGKDNLVLRLNYRMMEEFKQLGDGIYSYVDF